MKGRRYRSCTYTFYFALLVIYSPILKFSSYAQEENKFNSIPTSCQYYLAPSSIPNSGFGVYTTKSIPSKTLLQKKKKYDGLSIIVTDEKLHFEEADWFRTDYFWKGDEYSADSTSESILGLGPLINYHPYLHSITPTREIYSDDLIPRDSGSPGVGASTLHGGWQFESTREILAGEELFADYGEGWLGYRSKKKFNPMPSKSSYNTAAAVLKVMHTYDNTTSNGPGVNLETGSEETGTTDHTLSTIKDIVSLFNKQASSLIPTTTKTYFETIAPEDDARTIPMNDIASNRTTPMNDIVSNIVRKFTTPRTLDWIRNEGQCLDNLVGGRSTLPDAGRGGFAQRFISKDSIVVPVPLLHIMHHNSMLMYDLEFDQMTREMKKKGFHGSISKPTGKQMLINYCFSHSDIDILLCPQSNAALLNHCSVRKSYGGDCDKYNKNGEDGKKGPNAKVTWSGNKGLNNWDLMTIPQIRKSILSGTDFWEKGLSFNIIATRDIFPGEEVFIDYGLEWEKAWDTHVEKWIPPSTESYTPISRLNSLITLRTPKELETNPYPDNAQMECVYWERGYDVDEEEDIIDNEEINEVKTIIRSGENFKRVAGRWNSHEFYPCRVVDLDVSINEKITYVVEVFEKREQHTNLMNKNRKSWTLNHYPRDSILFIPKKYSSDEHLKDVFRHYIPIKDDMIPLIWKEVPIDCSHFTNSDLAEMCKKHLFNNIQEG